MIKSIEKIVIVLLIVTLAFGMVCLNYSYATEATISVSPAKVNQNFTVTVNIPTEAVAYQGKIEVTFSNGTTLSSGNLVKVTGVDGNFAHPGNMTFTCKAPAAGVATVKVTGLVISDKNYNQINTQTSLQQAITVTVEAPAPTTPAPVNNDPGYTATGDKVYALENLNVRTGPSSNDQKLGTLSKGSSTKRIAVGDNGWDKVEYGDRVGFVVSKYLTTKQPTTGDSVANTTNNTTTNTTNTSNTNNTTDDNKVKEPAWTPTGDTVYSKKSLNVREGWGTSFKSIGGLEVGEKTKRIAVGDNGWDKIEYEGNTAYVMSKYLTTSKAEAEKLVEELKEKEENNTETNSTNTNSVENTNIVNDTNTTQNDEVYNAIVDEIGVIPQVGKSILDYTYIVIVIIGLLSVGFVSLKIHEKNEE